MIAQVSGPAPLSQTAVRLALLMLSPLQRRVIVRRFGLEGARQRTAPEIARIEGLSVLEVRCLEALALDNLRSKLALCQSPQETF